MEHHAHTSHSAPGFGKNTNGLGIFIVAVIFVALGLASYYLWNNDNKQVQHYRLPAESSHAAHGHH